MIGLVDFVFCGRGPSYAGGYAGEAGLERWVEMMDEQIRNTMLLTNSLSFEDIDDSIIARWGDQIFDQKLHDKRELEFDKNFHTLRNAIRREEL